VGDERQHQSVSPEAERAKPDGGSVSGGESSGGAMAVRKRVVVGLAAWACVGAGAAATVIGLGYVVFGLAVLAGF